MAAFVFFISMYSCPISVRADKYLQNIWRLTYNNSNMNFLKYPGLSLRAL